MVSFKEQVPEKVLKYGTQKPRTRRVLMRILSSRYSAISGWTDKGTIGILYRACWKLGERPVR